MLGRAAIRRRLVTSHQAWVTTGRRWRAVILREFAWGGGFLFVSSGFVEWV